MAAAYTNTLYQTDVGFTDTRIDQTGRASAAYTDPHYSLAGSYSVTRGNENSSREIPYWTQLGDAQFGYVFTPTISGVLIGSYEYQEPDIGEPFATGIGRVGGTFALGPDGTFELQGGFSTFMTQGADTKLRPSFLLAYSQRFATFVVRADFLSGFDNRSDALDSTGVTFTRSAGIFVTNTELLFRQLTGTVGVRWTEEEFQQTSTFGGPPAPKIEHGTLMCPLAIPRPFAVHQSRVHGNHSDIDAKFGGLLRKSCAARTEIHIHAILSQASLFYLFRTLVPPKSQAC